MANGERCLGTGVIGTGGGEHGSSSGGGGGGTSSGTGTSSGNVGGRSLVVITSFTSRCDVVGGFGGIGGCGISGTLCLVVCCFFFLEEAPMRGVSRREDV